MTSLADHLRSRPDRCSRCGWHPETQGHSPGCIYADEHSARKPTDPMTAARDGGDPWATPAPLEPTDVDHESMPEPGDHMPFPVPVVEERPW